METPSPEKTAFHQQHFGLFTGPNPANWIRKMEGRILRKYLHECEGNLEGMIELASLLTAEQGASLGVFGVGVEIFDEEDSEVESVPVAVYYYTMVDTGRTSLDPTFVQPTRAEEHIVELPEWFPCQKTAG